MSAPVDAVVMASPFNVVVTGLARSGLTATCQMLAAGGMRVAGAYPAFEPFEVGCIPWGRVNGQVVKLVDGHRHLPPRGRYAVIRLQRDLSQQAKSFAKFTAAMFGVAASLSSGGAERVVASFRRDYEMIDQWASEQQQVMRLEFERIIEQPKVVASELAAFLGVSLDVDAAAGVIIPRSPECHPELLELRMF